MEKKKSILLFVPVLLVLAVISLSGYLDSDSRTDWAFEETQLEDMNDRGFRGEGIRIGIVDTGINIGHPDLKDMNIIAWRDFINDEPEPYDDKGHGSHVAGLIGADGEITGGAPKADFIIAKALDSEGGGDDSTVAEAINWCVDQGADVICLSLGNDAVIPRIGEFSGLAARNAVNQGVMVVASAGNDGRGGEEGEDDGDVNRPATVDGVIAVGAVDEDLKIAPFSSMGDNDGITSLTIDDRTDPDKKPEVVAPGVKIRSTHLDRTYAIMSGTSQAAPFVASGIALMLEEHPEYKREGATGGNSDAVEKIKEAIMKGAYKLPGQEVPHDDHYGYGLIRVVDSSAYL